MPASVGTVYLIGAGPGDPKLLTLRGRECLERADLVLYDYLAEPGLLKWTRPGADTACLGRHGQGKLCSQPEINQRMVEAALTGRTVARLKGGDPSVFGRLAEEIDALSAAGVPFEIVPGVTAASAAGAYAGVTITDREHASCVTFVTGREHAQKGDQGLDYAALARLPGTLVIYMGVTTAGEWSSRLIEGGKPAETPVVLVRRCSLPDQSTRECSLGEVAEVLAPGAMRPPIVAIVGPVARHESISSWFTSRPLFGQTVLVTRPRGQAGATMDRLAELGAEALYQPAITIEPPGDWTPVDRATDRLGEFDWIVFSSRNGVEAFVGRMLACGFDARRFGRARLAAIGPGTAAALEEFHLRPDLHPAEYRAEALAAALADDASGQRMLLVRASRGRETLAEMLGVAGASVEQVVAYASRDTPAPDAALAEAMTGGRVHWTTVTSSAIARSLVRMFGETLRETRLAAISPLTAGVLDELGFPAEVVAERYTGAGVIDAIVKSVQQRRA